MKFLVLMIVLLMGCADATEPVCAVDCTLDVNYSHLFSEREIDAIEQGCAEIAQETCEDPGEVLRERYDDVFIEYAPYMIGKGVYSADTAQGFLVLRVVHAQYAKDALEYALENTVPEDGYVHSIP